MFVDSKYVLSAFSFNRVMGLSAGVAQTTVKPGEAIQIFVLPRSLEGVVSHPMESIWARVIRPDGSEDRLELHDRGRDNTGRGDDVPQDGTFTGIYENTQLKGAYTFVISSDIEPRDARIDFRSRETLPEPVPSPRFVRQSTLSAAVAAPGDIELDPEDGPGKTPPWWEDYCKLVVILLAVALVLTLFSLLFCCLWNRIFKG